MLFALQIKTISSKVQTQIGQDSPAKTKSASKEVTAVSTTETDKKSKNLEYAKSEGTEWSLKLCENGDVNHVAIVDQIREAASEVARDQFLKVF